MADGVFLLNGFSLKFTDADDLVTARNLVGQVVQGAFAKAIQVWIPRTPGAYVEAPLPSVLQHFVAFILHSDRCVFSRVRGLGKDGVKRAIVFLALLNEVEVLALIV